MTKTIKTTKTKGPVAEVCLYGVASIGHGWIARARDGRMSGDGEPLAGRGLTAALWLALDAVEAFGLAGSVLVFEPTGRFVATVSTKGARPYFGSLTWTTAPVYVISPEALAKAKE